MTVLVFLQRHWKPAAVLILLLIWTIGVHNDGAERERSKWELITARDAAKSAKALAKAEAEARQQEQKWAAAFDVAATIQHEEMKNVAAHRDRLLADLRAGRLRFQACPAQVPQAAADSSQPESRAEGGQPGMVGEELVARLAVCDEVTLERNQAVRLLEAERL